MQPTGRLEPQPWMTAPQTAALLDALRAPGVVARFVGGSVRNALLGVQIDDIDLAITCAPEETMRLLRQAGIRVIATGLDHGTVTAVIDRLHFEITTLRRDVETFGRKARVEYTDDWLEDARRRDFTFNAMFCDADGTLYDPFDGRRDLAQGRVRFVGSADERIREDVLRILRFFRFFAWYGRPPADADALAACRALAPEMARLSGERVQKEMMRLLQAADPLPALKLMLDNCVLADWLPEFSDTAVVAALVPLERQRGEADAERRLAALLSPGSDGASVAARWRLSNASTERLQAALAAEPAFRPDDSPSDRRRHLYRLRVERYVDRVLLAWARAAAAGEQGGADFGAWLALAREWPVPGLPVSGADVLACGVPAGPRVGEVLRAVEAWWMAGDFAADRASCLVELKRRIEADGNP